MTCLTLTPQSVAEAIESQANMVVSHHPLPFKAISKLTTHTQTGRMLWELARAGISVYSPHTAWDSAPGGINAQLAELLGLQECRPIIPHDSPPVAHDSTVAGTGRRGKLAAPQPLTLLIDTLSQGLSDCRPRGVDSGQPIEHVAIACGSGGSLLEAALAAGACDLFLTGEATFHTALAAQAAGISLLMIGHFASERFAMVHMASEMHRAFDDLHVWASRRECDPVKNLAAQ